MFGFGQREGKKKEREEKKRSHEILRKKNWREDEGMGWDSIFFLFSIEFHDEPSRNFSNGSTRASPASGTNSPHHLLQRSRSQFPRSIQGSLLLHILADFIYFNFTRSLLALLFLFWFDFAVSVCLSKLVNFFESRVRG